MLLRDRRTLVIAALAPLVVFPAVLLIMRATERSRQEELATAEVLWAASGPDAEAARSLMADAADVVGGIGEGGFREVVAADPDSLLDSGVIQLVVTVVATDSVPLVQLGYRSDRERSTDAARRARAALDSLRTLRRS